MLKKVVCAVFLTAMVSVGFAADLVVKILQQQDKADIGYGYYLGLAKLALDKTIPEFGPYTFQTVSITWNEARAFKELENKTIDLFWAGTDPDREKTFKVVFIPLEAGLLGYRVPVIRKADTPVYDKIKTLDDLKKYSALSGSDWPDSDILEASGIKVIRTPQFESMYPMLKAKRVDYFPRGLNEAYAEVANLKDPDFVAYDSLMVFYKLYSYFFTDIKNTALADRIEKGLLKAIADGSFLSYMQKSEVLKDVFPLSKYKSTRIISIDNPLLAKAAPIHPKSLILTVGK